MRKLLRIIIFVYAAILFFSCNTTNDTEFDCDDNFKNAKELAYKNPNDNSSLDLALSMANDCMKCDSIKAAVIDLKIRLLIQLSKLKEGAEFISSLKVSDFSYPYKKDLLYDNFVALNFASEKDTINSNFVYQKIAADLKTYIYSHNLDTKEFQEAVTDWSSLSEKSIGATISNQQLDSLKIKYPNQVQFLKFFN